MFKNPFSAGFDMHASVVIVRVFRGLDYSSVMRDDETESVADDGQVRIHSSSSSVRVGFSGVVVETPPVTPVSPTKSIDSSVTSGGIMKRKPKKSLMIPNLRYCVE